MTRTLFIAIGPLALLAGCSAAEEAGNEAFDTNFLSSCKSSGSASGAPQEVIDSYCGCALDKINEQYSGSEKLNLSPENVQPIMTECLAEVQKNG